MSTLLILLVAGVVVFLGSLVQGSIGLGMNLIAAPPLVLLEPELVPVPLLVALIVLATLTLFRELGDTDWRGVGFAVSGRVPGSVLGVLVVALLPVAEFSITVGILVLGFVALSMSRWQLRPGPTSLAAAGFAGGVTGTAASIGGPPVALLYQHSDGPCLRATMAAYSVFGTLVSLVVLAGAGQFDLTHLLNGLALVPFMAAGFWGSGPLRRHLSGPWLRIAVLAVSAASAIVLIVRGLLM